MLTPPRLIALCGNPKSGKSLVQEIIGNHYGHAAVDDGYTLREFAVEKLGLSWDDVITQEGKARSTNILGRDWVNRDLLGEFGNRLEDMFGEHIMPLLALKGCSEDQRYTFGSVRKTQGRFYREHGGVVIEIANPLASPSGYAFDMYDREAVDITIVNDGQQRFAGDDKAAYRDLEAKVIAAIEALNV